MSLPHEHEFEAAPGLPEALPAGEHILWQGAPDWRQLAVQAFHVRQLAVYFAAMLALQAALLRADGAQGAALAAPLVLSASLALLALALLAATAWMAARGTLYTLTNRRVVMRVGIVLTLTFNLPLRQIAGAALKPLAGGHGDIALALKAPNRIAWLHLWPHARPWQLRQPQPLLRCLANAQAVGALVQQSWLAANPGAAVQAAAQPAAALAHTPPTLAV